MKNFYLTLALLLSIFSNLTYANTCIPSENKLTIYFGNGMSNTPREAELSSQILRAKLKPQLNNFSTSYKSSINSNEFFLIQIKEVGLQKAIESWESLWAWIDNPNHAPEWFKESIRGITRGIQIINIVSDEDLADHIKNYEESIENCNRVLIVGHSQGNFYANTSWNEIYSRKVLSDTYTMKNIPALGIISVATPADHVGRPLLVTDDHKAITNYTTLTNDDVINYFRNAGFDILEGNETNTLFSLDDPNWNHSFTTYLNGDRSGYKIVKDIKNVVNNLEPLPVQRTEVNSSYIKSMEYVNQQFLEVELAEDGSIYRYYDVPQNVIDNLPSAGDAAKDMLAIYKSRLIYQGNIPQQLLIFSYNPPFRTTLFDISTGEVTTHEEYAFDLEVLNAYERTPYAELKANQPFLGKAVEGQISYQAEGKILIKHTDGSASLIEHTPLKLLSENTFIPWSHWELDEYGNPLYFIKTVSAENLDGIFYEYRSRYEEYHTTFKSMIVGNFTIVPIKRLFLTYRMNLMGQVTTEGLINSVNSYLVIDKDGQVLEQISDNQYVKDTTLLQFQKK